MREGIKPEDLPQGTVKQFALFVCDFCGCQMSGFSNLSQSFLCDYGLKNVSSQMKNLKKKSLLDHSQR